jgi:hypothetical protein
VIHLAAFVILGWAGLIYGLTKRGLRWMAVVPLFFTLLQLLFIPISRYMFPLTPLMAVLAAVLAGVVLERFSGTGYKHFISRLDSRTGNE